MQPNNNFKGRSRPGGSRGHQNNRPNRNFRKTPRPLQASRFINKAIAREDETPYEAKHSFADFGFDKRVEGTLDHIGYYAPSPIQDMAIKPAMAGHDVIGLANTGTGKTAAFALPTINKLLDEPKIASVLVLAPTRELAQQIDEEFRRFSSGLRIFSAVVVGGANIMRQIQQIKRGPHVIIGTPGRLNDLIDRKVLRLSGVETFILDEADRMCDMGFVNDIRRIEAELPKEHQTLCFSATMTMDVQKIVEKFMHDPVSISVVKSETNDHIEQDVIHTNDKAHKLETLVELLADSKLDKVLVFGETKFGVQRLADALNRQGFPSEAIHGNKSQSQRERALRSFKSGQVRILVATDVAARGLDIPNVSHVINFDAPTQYDDYIHRIGRTGRAGLAGTALTFV